MDKEFPSYKELFELTKRRLNGLRKIRKKKTGELNFLLIVSTLESYNIELISITEQLNEEGSS